MCRAARLLLNCLLYTPHPPRATNWIVGFADLVVAQVVHKCYLYGGGAGVALPAWPISRSAYNGVRYHLGSVSLGSLVVAFFQFFRYALAWLAARFKKVGEKEGLVRLLLWLATCLAWFLSWVVDLITGSAYCIIAIDGSGFCAAAATAARLVVANALRLATVAFVGDAIVFLAKLGTAATCAFFCFVYLDHYEEGAISSPLGAGPESRAVWVCAITRRWLTRPRAPPPAQCPWLCAS